MSTIAVPALEALHWMFPAQILKCPSPWACPSPNTSHAMCCERSLSWYTYICRKNKKEWGKGQNYTNIMYFIWDICKLLVVWCSPLIIKYTLILDLHRTCAAHLCGTCASASWFQVIPVRTLIVIECCGILTILWEHFKILCIIIIKHSYMIKSHWFLLFCVIERYSISLCCIPNESLFLFANCLFWTFGWASNSRSHLEQSSLMVLRFILTFCN